MDKLWTMDEPSINHHGRQETKRSQVDNDVSRRVTAPNVRMLPNSRLYSTLRPQQLANEISNHERDREMTNQRTERRD